MSAAPYDTQEIRRCLTLLAPDGVFEVRAPKARMTGYRSATAAGYFNTHDDTAIAMIGSPSGKAVSYTHLDVYKRQAFRKAVKRNWSALSALCATTFWCRCFRRLAIQSLKRQRPIPSNPIA